MADPCFHAFHNPPDLVYDAGLQLPAVYGSMETMPLKSVFTLESSIIANISYRIKLYLVASCDYLNSPAPRKKLKKR
jgi:hypothetical protein